MNGIGIKSLENFPELENLQILELNNNHLNGDDLKNLVSLFPNLYKIKLEKNKIESLENFKEFSKSKLKKINLLDNPVCQNEDYKQKLFEMIPNLMSVDGIDREGNEIESTNYGEEENEEDEFEGVDFEGEEDEEEENEDDEENEGNDDDEEDEGKPKKKNLH